MDSTLGSCGSVERDSDDDGWRVKVSRARNRFDMRKARLATCGCSGSCSHRGTPAVVSSSHMGSLCSLDRDSVRSSIDSVDQFRGKWEKVSVIVDSGAIDSVIPDSVALGFQKRDTAASRQGLKYRAANGTPIANEGEKTLQGYSNEGKPLGITMQVAKVTKPLGSVRAMLEANNMVVFDKGNSYIMDKNTWAKTKLEERNGAYVFDLWIPKGNEAPQQVNTGRYQPLMQDSSSEGSRSMGFVGLDDLF